MSNINLGNIKKIVYDGNKEVSIPSGDGGEEQWEFVSDLSYGNSSNILEPNTLYKIRVESLDVIAWGGGLDLFFVDPTDNFYVQMTIQSYSEKEFVFSTHSFSEVQIVHVDFQGAFETPTGIELYKRVS